MLSDVGLIWVSVADSQRQLLNLNFHLFLGGFTITPEDIMS